MAERKYMRWYYFAIMDWMIANPGRPLRDCAAHIGRTPSTLSLIINSDMFKAAFEERKRQFQMQHDLGIIEKTTKVANASLDALLEAVEKKRDKIPIDVLNDIAESSLTRLGYGITPSQPSMQVNVNGQATIIAPVSMQDLEEARMAMRQVQANKGAVPLPPPPQADPLDRLLELTATEAEPDQVRSVEVDDAPTPQST